jgi:integrase
MNIRQPLGLSEVARGSGPRTDQRETLADYLASWLRERIRPSKRPSTYRTYEYIVRVHLAPALGRVAVARLDVRQVQKFLNAKGQSGLSAQTVGHIRAVLRAALGDAMRWGLVERNAAALAEPPRVRRRIVAAMSPEEASAIFGAVSNDRLAALYVLALTTGLRQGELLGLRWADLDQDGRTLKVERAVEPKTERSRRTVTMTPLAVDALRGHRLAQLNERMAAGSAWTATDLVFTTHEGGPLDGVNVTHRLHVLLGTAGLPQLRFHDLRHGCASLLLAEGVHPRVVMEVLGHSQIALTMNTYSHVIPALQVDAADQLDAALRRVATS